MLTYFYYAYLMTVKSVHFISSSKYLLYTKYICMYMYMHMYEREHAIYGFLEGLYGLQEE